MSVDITKRIHIKINISMKTPLPTQLSQVSKLSTGVDMGAGGVEAPFEMLKGCPQHFGLGPAPPYREPI